jgi:hypothetical protein
MCSNTTQFGFLDVLGPLNVHQGLCCCQRYVRAVGSSLALGPKWHASVLRKGVGLEQFEQQFTARFTLAWQAAKKEPRVELYGWLRRAVLEGVICALLGDVLVRTPLCSCGRVVLFALTFSPFCLRRMLTPRLSTTFSAFNSRLRRRHPFALLWYYKLSPSLVADGNAPRVARLR